MARARGVLVESPAAAVRLAAASAWLADRRRAEPLVVVAASPDAANDLLRTRAEETGALFGSYRFTLARLAATLAGGATASAGLAPAGTLTLEALAARVAHRGGEATGLGRFHEVAGTPGFARSLARTFTELRLEAVGAEAVAAVDPDLAAIYRAFEAELGAAKLYDRAWLYRAAAEVAGNKRSKHPLLGLPTLFLDVPVASRLEADLAGAIAARAGASFLATVPAGDERTLRHLGEALGPAPPGTNVVAGAVAGSIARLQAALFRDETMPLATLDDAVVVFSAPGENRECVEIVRHIQREAEGGVRFDRMAVLLRAPAAYRAHLEEAFRRGGVAAHFAAGTVAPDPAGRALLALLATAGEDLSARRFAEYLSLGEVPDATAAGEPPAAAPRSATFATPDDEVVAASIAAAGLEREAAACEDEERLEDGVELPADPESVAVVAGNLRAPRHWEALLVEAAVIGGRDRWERRLSGLAEQIASEISGAEDPEDAATDRRRRDLAALATLRRYALPLLDDLARLPAQASWGEWLDVLAALATRALRHPDRVLGVLAELQPMATVGPVDLAEVRLVLQRRLADLPIRPAARREGKVFVGSPPAARGLAFEVVFVPGLAERIFPHKVSEDPMLLDADRERIAPGLARGGDRIAGEKLALRLAAGAATRRIVFSYPRLDLEQSRPRVPSFYCLEVFRAAEGRLPDFEEFARRASQVGAARIGWPAPDSPADAIDAAEHDLALLRQMFDRPPSETIGTARYLMGVNPHLARALRFRARRWHPNWHPADGLVKPGPEATVALAAHALGARSYSPTALENYSVCPYKFVLQALFRLAPREEPEAIEEIDPLERGSLVHEVQFELLGELHGAGLLPIDGGNLGEARSRLDRVLARVAAGYRERLAPAIERVWLDGIAGIQADLREWLRRATADDSGFVPWRFELGFGLKEPKGKRDALSFREPVALDCGIRLRGSIDLVERRRDGVLRATDHKTGKVRAETGAVIGGGTTLQPVLYALAIEKLFPDDAVDSGRLYYCTLAAGFTERTVPLDGAARAGAAAVATTVGEALAAGFLPAAPAKGACQYCDYRPVCGPYEEFRTGKIKRQEELKPLARLRSLP
jgi:CRISPR/Cas system-associated exonuclease Cas4 (RecB family)